MDVLDITAPEIRAELLRLESQYRERKLKYRECLRLAYDQIARSLVKSGVSLDDLKLRLLIPGAVLDAAAGYGWVEHPGKRWEARKRHVYDSDPWIQNDYFVIDRFLVDIPEPELTVQLGSFRVTPQYYEGWLRLLRGRIAHWEAESIHAFKLGCTSIEVTSPRRDRVSKQPTKKEREERAATREAAVNPLLQAKKPVRWTTHFWSKKAGMIYPHAAYRYLKGENISEESRGKLAKALGEEIPE